MIYCFGDSHINFLKMVSNDFSIHWTGSLIAYNLNNKIEAIDDFIKRTGINKKDDILLFSFGEIDCRLHILQQSQNQGRSENEITMEVVKEYHKFLVNYKDKGFNVAVWGPIPTLPDNQKHDKLQYTGAHEERNRVTKLFTEYLKSYCETDFKVISIYDELTEDCVTKDRYHNGVHLNENAKSIAAEKFYLAGLI